MGHLEHKAQSPAVANCYILTISDTRTEATDTSGRAIVDLLWAGGHQVAGRKIVRDEPDQVRGAIRDQLASPHVQVDHHDRRHRHHVARHHVRGDRRAAREAAGRLRRAVPDAELPGDRLGGDAEPRVRGPRRRTRSIFSLPGSENAVRLAMTKLVLPELGHLVREASRR